MSTLLKVLNPAATQYKDRRFEGSEDDWENAIGTSATVYIGNLNFFTREEQIYDIFSRVAHVKRVVMGLDKNSKTPCGFAFVIFYTRKAAEASVSFLNGTLLDERPIRVDIDWGFMDGRQFGRGRSGGQVRDEFRQDYDPGRGGYGKIIQREFMMQLGSGMGQESQHGGYRGRPEGRGGGDPKRQRLEGGGAAAAGRQTHDEAGGEQAVGQEAEAMEGEGGQDAMQEGEGGGAAEPDAEAAGAGGVAENPRFRPESDDEVD